MPGTFLFERLYIYYSFNLHSNLMRQTLLLSHYTDEEPKAGHYEINNFLYDYIYIYLYIVKIAIVSYNFATVNYNCKL